MLKEQNLNWLLSFLIAGVFVFNYFYLFSYDFKKSQKIEILLEEVQNWEKSHIELTSEIIKLRTELEKLRQGRP